MNTNPNAKRILCYGDSITRGRVPSVKQRFGVQARRTGVMQHQLGNGFEVIEEGLRGRTTNLFDKEGKGKHGLDYFLPCFYSHLPLDFVIIFLGTNNLQKQFEYNMQDLIDSFDIYMRIIKDASGDYEVPVPKVILVSPPYIDGSYLKEDTIFSEYSGSFSQLFGNIYKKKAEELGIHFFDAAGVVGTGRGDGVHLDLEQNQLLGNALATYIQTL